MRLLTNDLYEAAWLLSQGMALEKLWHSGNACLPGVRQRKRTVVFEFIGNASEDLLEEYRQGKALGNVARFRQAQEEIKDKMFDLLRKREPEKTQHTLRVQGNGKGGNYVRTFEEAIQ